MEIYEIDPSYQITAYHCDPVPKPGDEYIDEKGSVYIVRGQVVEAPRPLVLGLDDWDQGYTFRLYPSSEHNVDGPKGKLRRILPKEEIQEARSALIKKLRDENHMIGIHSVGMNRKEVLIYADKGVVKNPDPVGYVPVRVIES